MKTIECAEEDCHRDVTVADDAEDVVCIRCKGVTHRQTYAARQARSYRADAHRHNLVNYGRCKR